jgi:hypothetical protein
MLKSTAALGLTALLLMTAAAQAGGSRRERINMPAPAASAGTVNNYYGAVTIYQGAAPAYGSSYSSAAPAYGYGYGYSDSAASASSSAYAGAYANSYGASGYYGDVGAPWGPPFAGGVGYSPYGNYGYGYGAQAPVYSGARMSPWNGYYGGPGNGYW